VLANESASVEYFLSTMVDAPPTVAITPVSPNPRSGAVAQLQIVFSKPVTGFTLTSLSLSESGGANLLTSSQTLTTTDNTTFWLGNLSALTGSTGSYSLTLTAAGSGITDTVGNALANSASTSFVENIPEAVTSTLDDGVGSLRQALRDVAAAPGLTHTIKFSLPAGPQTIELLTPLPVVTDPLIVALDETQNIVVATSSSAAWDGYAALTKTGAGTLTLSDASSFSGNILVDEGSLRFSVSASLALGPGITAAVTGSGTLEFAGRISVLTGGPDGVNVSNDSAAQAGILITGTNQVVGAISGLGNLVIDAGGSLTANCVRQSALVIDGDAGSLATVTIAPSDGNGDPLARATESSSGVVSAVAADSGRFLGIANSTPSPAKDLSRSPALAMPVARVDVGLPAELVSAASATGSGHPLSTETASATTGNAAGGVTVATVTAVADTALPLLRPGGGGFVSIASSSSAERETGSSVMRSNQLPALDSVFADWFNAIKNHRSARRGADPPIGDGEPPTAGLADDLLVAAALPNAQVRIRP
jgi:autotransporter-associated beta strand protein